MGLLHLRQGGRLFLLCHLAPPPVRVIPGVAWRGRIPVPVVSAQVGVVVREVPIAAIVIVVLINVLVVSTCRSASPIEMQHTDMPILAPLHNPITTLIPLEEVVIEPRCSPGSPGVEFVEGSSEGKVEGTPEYVPTSPSVDWNAVADEMAADPYDHDSLNEDTLEKHMKQVGEIRAVHSFSKAVLLGIFW
jgi:hypothetical protein